MLEKHFENKSLMCRRCNEMYTNAAEFKVKHASLSRHDIAKHSYVVLEIDKPESIEMVYDYFDNCKFWNFT